MDGIAEGVGALSSLLRTTKSEKRPISIGIFDLKKAFDSVSHKSIHRVLLKHRLPIQFIEYVMAIYKGATTILSFKGDSSQPLIPAKGVRQGDALSPLIFLLVFDEILTAIPEYEGVKYKGAVVNRIAYADDLISNNKAGLQNIIDKISTPLYDTGLEFNIQKCFTITWLLDGKNKRLIYDHTRFLRINNQQVETIKITDSFKYLGVCIYHPWTAAHQIRHPG